MKEVNKNNSRWIFQIILPMVSCFLIIVICAFLLISGVRDGAFNLHMLRDISTAFLLLLVFPSGLLFLATMIAFIYLTNKSYKWFQRIFPNIQSIFLWIEPIVNKLCNASTHPYIFSESIHAIFKKKMNPEG